MKPIRLAIVSTHPIQHYAPLFKALTASTGIHPGVFFTGSQISSGAVPGQVFDGGVEWDIRLLDGYEFEFVANVARRPRSDHFWGMRNPLLLPNIEKWQPDALLVCGWNFVSHLNAMRRLSGRIPVFFRGDSTLP